MRIDKFLKVSRLIKRRTVANEVADAGRISVNGREVKASYQVKIGDEIMVKCIEIDEKGRVNLSRKVLLNKEEN